MSIDLSYIQRLLDWVKKQVFLDSISSAASKRRIRRGQVYWCNFGFGIGNEIQKERPAVIIQNDSMNISSGNTIVIPITHNTKTLNCIVPIKERLNSDGTILLDGSANTSNIMCVNKARLGDYICDLTNSELKDISRSLSGTVDVMKYYSDLEKKYKKCQEELVRTKEKMRQLNS